MGINSREPATKSTHWTGQVNWNLRKSKRQEKNFSLDLSGDKVLDEERILEVRLNRNGADPVYFYTRIVSDEYANVAQCLNYISDYHENALGKVEMQASEQRLNRLMMRTTPHFST